MGKKTKQKQDTLVKEKKDQKNSSTDKKSAASNRAKWEVDEEFALLEEYAELRKDPKAATDKGLTKAAWGQLMVKLNAKHKNTLEKGKYKSKVSRLMQDYDVYMEMKAKSGVGVCFETGKLTFPDDDWERLERSKPKNIMDKIKRFRKYGFEHECACFFAAGDVRATGSEAESITGLAKRLGNPGNSASTEENPVDVAEIDPVRRDDAVEKTASNDGADSDSEEEKEKAPKLSPSHERRATNVKRIRDGASISRRNAKKQRKESNGAGTEQLQALLETANKYFEFKSRQEMEAVVTNPPMPSMTSLLSGGDDDEEEEEKKDADELRGLDKDVLIAQV